MFIDGSAEQGLTDQKGIFYRVDRWILSIVIVERAYDRGAVQRGFMEQRIKIGQKTVALLDSQAIGTFVRFPECPGLLRNIMSGVMIPAKG